MRFGHCAVITLCRYYWRIEPGVNFTCNLHFDPFQFMAQHRKRYAFVITFEEIADTIPTLWDTTLAFAKEHQLHGQLDWLSNTHGRYNLCHYWSNFEIADLDFFRSEEYLAYFNHLDQAGGFFCALLPCLTSLLPLSEVFAN